MKLSDRLNAGLHRVFVRYVLHAYRRKSRKVEREHPELFKPVPPELARRHRELWSRVGLPCTDRWLRFHVNLTGIPDHRFCPEDIFFARIERILNDCSCAGRFVEDKNSLHFFVPMENQPGVVIRRVNGVVYDAAGHVLSPEACEAMLSQDHGDLVAKPCICSSGGQNVELLRFHDGHYMDEAGNRFDLSSVRRRHFTSYIVQQKVQQSSFPASFNAASINTCRMITLRLPWSGEVVVLKTMLRMGVQDVVVDNMMKGGLCVNIGGDGTFSRYAYDYNGRRYETHPGSGVRFAGLRYPDFEAMKAFATETARRIQSMNMLSFDLVPGADGHMKCLEINATSQGITQLQFDHGGLFGEHTEQVVEWCAHHLDLDRFDHFRTFY